MNKIDRDELIKKGQDTLNNILDMLQNLPSISIESLPPERTAFVIIDMVNGFVREGMLKSDRIEKLIPEIVSIIGKCRALKLPIVAFADCHTKESPEFGSYPCHCMKDSSESEMVDEIKSAGGYTLIYKNSTNGFLEKDFEAWLKEHQQIDNFIISGDCTDICIMQFALTLKTYFNMKNIRSNIIVPLNMVETFDLPPHDGDVMNIFALYALISGGINVVDKIE